MAKITLQITDMHCSNCAILIESLEDELPDVHEIRASYPKSQVVVTYNENTMSSGEIIQALKILGYTAILPGANSSSDQR
jgi:copper chaperone CopZ